MRYLATIAACLGMIPAAALELTGMTLFECDRAGAVVPQHRYNAGPVDAAWDLFLYAGEAAMPGTEPQWLNDRGDNTIHIPLGPGIHTFTFHTESGDAWPRTGINLFFDGQQDAAAISAMAVTNKGAAPYPEMAPNSAEVTMGLPIADIPGAGALHFANTASGLWAFAEAEQHYEVTLEAFRFSIPDVEGNLDLVGPHAVGPSGTPDFVGQIVLKVEAVDARPPALLGWLATEAEMTLGGPDRRASWREALGDGRIPAPFSFQYGDESSETVLARCARRDEGQALDDHRYARTLTYNDPETGLEIRWEGVEYRDFKTVEWTVYFKNTVENPTPVLSQVQGIDAVLEPASGTPVVLHYTRGDTCAANSFEPLTKSMEPGEALHLAPEGGRPTNGAFPYFNLRAGDEGAIIAVGWPGQWAADFECDEEREILISAGQELTNFRLEPGEEVRTPLVVVQFSADNDWIGAQNTWRQWMIQYNIPKEDNAQIELPLFAACSSHQFAEMTKANEQNQIEFLDSYLAKGLKIDYWWMDAGWYVGAEEKNWPWTGTWEVDRRPHRFPNGLRAVSDHAHERGAKTIVWFEPERVAEGTWLTTEHPEWVFGGAKGGLLNLGNPDAWNWLVNHIDKLITDEGIDLYRQDYNIDPLHFWRDNDTEDRQGITENKYVTGYLAYWDELRRRHPGMLIDSCASGGRRNDLETMRRAIPLLRSDYLFEPVGQQGHTYGLSMWLPVYGTGYNPSNTVGWGEGTGGNSYNPYMRRSNMCPANIGCFDFRVAVDDALIQKLYQEWLEIAPDYYGDYYPLTAWNLEQDGWIAWQFHRPEAGQGFVQCFRRKDSGFYGGSFLLHGLDADTEYEVRNFDEEGVTRMTGKTLMEQGLNIEIMEKPGAAVLRYTKIE
jgi:alpha-galactosidase